MKKQEKWLPVVGFEGLYEVSDQGRVRSVDRRVQVEASPLRAAHVRFYKGRVLTAAQYCSAGHLSLPLGRRSNGIPVHILVAIAFVGPRPTEKHEVLHGNGNPKDNRADNLRWGTRTDNNKDITLHDRRKVSLVELAQLRKLRAGGASYKELSEMFGVCVSQVGNIVHRRHYAHV